MSVILYYFILSILLLFTFLYFKSTFKQNAFFLYAVFILALLAGIRDGVGNDYWNYVEIFNDVPTSIMGLLSYEGHSEFGLLWLCACVKKMGLSYHFIFFLISIISGSVFYKVCKNFSSGYLLLYLCLYYALFYHRFHFNTIRHGLMVSLVWWAFTFAYKKDLRRFFVCIGVSTCFHLLSLFFIPFYWLLNCSITLKKAIVFIILAIIIGFYIPIWDIVINIGGDLLFGEKVSYYVTDYYHNIEDASVGITMGLVLNIVFLFLLLMSRTICYDSIYAKSFLTIALFYSVFFSLLFNKYGIFVERISSVFNVSMIFLYPSIIMNLFKKKQDKWISILLMMVYVYLILYKILLSVNELGELQFIPYKCISPF